MDAFRCVLATAVAFGHAWALLIRDYQPSRSVAVDALYFAAGFAHASVILFFVLSGYWITKSVVGRVRAGWDWRLYLIDRLSRLMIVLVPALALSGLLDSIALYALNSPTHLGATDTFVLRTDVAANLQPEVLAGNLLFLQDILVRPYGSNGPLWSLAFEFWYYVWFPALLLSWRLRRPSLGLLALLFAFLTPYLALGFLSWLCGALLYFLEARLRSRAHLPLLRGLGPVLAAGALFAGVLFWGRTGDFSIEDPLLALAFAFFLLTLLLTNPRPVPGLRRLAAYGAAASFSLYATHFPLMAFATGLFLGAQRLAPTPAAIGLVGLTLAGSLAAAWLFSRLTEARTGTLRRTLRRMLVPPSARRRPSGSASASDGQND
ncbi:acyltransferase [Sphingomonas sp. BT-65]|uniref:acyltransferase family protein n=1 Tax=Sphingomonas sp. BT-65 TaxID=2989821 RepID=UPI0022355C0B|nr:acyltransferase [Sphingomonas sp. BT-65]MCW4463562.1 acyltransferase [Sphingomonas sp. BT-65]